MAWLGFADSEKALMMRTDLEGVISAVSPSFTEILGYTEDEVKGMNSWDFLHPVDKARTLVLANYKFGGKADTPKKIGSKLADLLKEGLPDYGQMLPQVDFRRRHKNGSYIPLRTQGGSFMYQNEIIHKETVLEVNFRVSPMSCPTAEETDHIKGGSGGGTDMKRKWEELA